MQAGAETTDTGAEAVKPDCAWKGRTGSVGSGRPVTRSGVGGRSPPRKFVATPGKMCWAYFKNIGHISKNFGHSRKTLRPSWCPKLVTGLGAGVGDENVEFCGVVQQLRIPSVIRPMRRTHDIVVR